MATFTRSDDLQGAQFVDADLHEARFVRADLSGAVMRGVDVGGLEIDSPWLLEDGGPLLVNGVDIVPLVDAELDRRFPGRSERHATDPAALRSAWAAVQRSWASALERAAALPDGAVDESVDGEWSFAQTLRHLVMGTDIWLRRTVLELDEPHHPAGQPIGEYELEGGDMSGFTTDLPSYDEVLDIRAGRVSMVGDVLDTVTSEQLAEQRRNPWDAARSVTVLHCLQVILREEWEHLRYALRDLEVLETRR